MNDEEMKNDGPFLLSHSLPHLEMNGMNWKSGKVGNFRQAPTVFILISVSPVTPSCLLVSTHAILFLLDVEERGIITYKLPDKETGYSGGVGEPSELKRNRMPLSCLFALFGIPDPLSLSLSLIYLSLGNSLHQELTIKPRDKGMESLSSIYFSLRIHQIPVDKR